MFTMNNKVGILLGTITKTLEVLFKVLLCNQF